MVATPLKTRLKGLEAALLPVLLLFFSSPPSLYHPILGQLFLSLDMLRPALAALFSVRHRHGARCCYRTGNAKTAC